MEVKLTKEKLIEIYRHQQLMKLTAVWYCCMCGKTSDENQITLVGGSLYCRSCMRPNNEK